MNVRSKFLKIARFELTDELLLPREWQWFWITTLERWRKEGLPEDVYLSQFFGFERMEMFPIMLGILPAFEWRVLEETKDYRMRLKKRCPAKKGQYLVYNSTYRTYWIAP